MIVRAARPLLDDHALKKYMDQRLDSFKTELKEAIRKHYKQLMDTVPGVYGYALCTEDGVSSFGPVANQTSSIPVPPSDPMYNYYRFVAVEWKIWDDFGLFRDVNAIVKDQLANEKLDFSQTRDALLRRSLSAMCELDAEGIFGSKNNDRFVVICISDSDDAIMIESAKLLNTTDVFEAYAAEFY